MTDREPPDVGVVVPTLNAGELWSDCLAAIGNQILKPVRRLVIDSASTDKTVERAQAAGFEILHIERQQFNHGSTRQRAVDYLTNCDIIVFLTQDAILATPNSLADLVRCFDDPDVAVAYGRQLPHKWATPIESHARLFNYGPRTDRKDAVAIQRLRAKAFFCSNSFAAYRRKTLLQLNGFSGDLILGEDMEVAARAIAAGFANIYCATATVYHSHDYTLRQTLRRYFDLGVFDARNPWMRRHFGSHRGEGIQFVKSELGYLATHAPFQIPRGLLQTVSKLMGYRLGRLEGLLPKSVKRRLSMLPSYWR